MAKVFVIPDVHLKPEMYGNDKMVICRGERY